MSGNYEIIYAEVSKMFVGVGRSADDPQIDNVTNWLCGVEPNRENSRGTNEACPRCLEESASIKLDRIDPSRHEVYRCRACGHLFGERIE